MPIMNLWRVTVALAVLTFLSEACAAGAVPGSLSGSRNVNPQTLGTCTWSHVSDEDRAAILTAYHQASLDGIDTHLGDLSQILVSRDETLHPAFTACNSTPDIPKFLYQAILSTQAIQTGAAAELEATHLVLRPHISRIGLDDAWAEAPAASRQCVRASAGKSFGVTDLTCPDLKATSWFLRKFGLNPYIQSDRPVAEQILIFYHSKAQAEFAEAAIAQIDKGLASKPTP